MAVFQNIKTKVSGLRCEIAVMNHQGHGVLTTYDQGVEGSVVDAQQTLESFWDECIDEFRRCGRGGLKPLVTGRTRDMPDGETVLIDIKAPDFDLSEFEQIVVQPVPLTGG